MNTALNRHLRDVLRTHLHPTGGSAYWLDRARQLGVRDADDIGGIEDLSRLGGMTPDDLRQRPLMDYVPRCYHTSQSKLVIGQTGGTTGRPVWTAYLPQEFDAAFVRPFVAASQHVGFPRQGTWLFVGPSGPHIIGQAARALACNTGCAEPFTVDFDPRWARKLPSGSVAAARYLQHVVDQAMEVIELQPIDVLFATPPVLLALADRMSEPQRARVRGVHYGGMAITAATLDRLQGEAFPAAVHLSGYGNTLLGCCLELNNAPGRALDYFPQGHRLLFTTVDADGRPAEQGRVCVCRFDHSFLIVNLTERDHAVLMPPPANAPEGFTLPGLRDPHTPAPKQSAVAALY